MSRKLKQKRGRTMEKTVDSFDLENNIAEVSKVYRQLQLIEDRMGHIENLATRYQNKKRGSSETLAYETARLVPPIETVLCEAIIKLKDALDSFDGMLCMGNEEEKDAGTTETERAPFTVR